MTTLQEAARKVLEAWQTSCYGKDAHQIAMVLAMTELRAALAQQGEQQPVCHGCGIPAGDVHMSTCKSGKWPSRVSKGDTAAPAPVVQQPIGYVTPGYFTFGHGIIDERQDEAKCIPVYAAAPAPQVTVEPGSVVNMGLPVEKLFFQAPAPQPTSGDYALGYAEGFNDACKPASQSAQDVPEVGFGNMPTKFLANGTRFKLSFDTRGKVSSLWNFMDELDGRWVALVAAEDDCHLQSAQPVAQPLAKTCDTCAHYQQGKHPGVSIHDETCYECRSYWGNKWEAA